MPIYEYRCTDCGQVFEEWQSDFKTRQMSCPVCKADSERLMSNTSFVLKGGGWYVTDYCKPGETACAANSKSAAAKPASEPASSGGEAAKPAQTKGSQDKSGAAAS